MSIKFLFELDKNIPTGPAYAAYEEGFIEGNLNIYVDDKLFFSEPYVNLAELGIQLGKWLKKTLNGFRENMGYDTIDHNEALINFFYEDRDGWRIYSIWQQFEINKQVNTTELVEAVLNYINNLNKELHEIDYVVKLDEYLK
jgi:hypothetical protein